MSKKMPEEFYSRLEELQAIDFVLVDLNLYLDTHPETAFEQKFGPLMHFGMSYSNYPFNWVDTPWPWQV